MHRYEWQSRGSAHIHGFMWLPNAPDMKTLDWENATEVHNAKDFFDQFISTWNTRENPQQDPFLPRSDFLDPCLLSTADIQKNNPFQDYTELLNCIQRHTKCSSNTCLRKKELLTHAVIILHGLFKTLLPCSLIPMGKKLTNQLAMMIV